MRHGFSGGACAVALVVLMLAGCSSKPKTPPSFAQRVGEAHGIQEWKGRGALAGDLHLDLLGEKPDELRSLDFHFVYEIATGKMKLDIAGASIGQETIAVWDGQGLWVSPASSQRKDVRAILEMWMTLITLPFRLEEPGWSVGVAETVELGGEKCLAARVERPGASAAGPKWFEIYADPTTHRLRGLAYGLGGESGLEQTAAITWYELKDHNGVVLPLEWRVWRWNKTAGIYGRPIGQGRLYNLDLIEPTRNAFARPGE